MSHLLIIELPGGNDLDIIDAALERGDEFTFLSAQLDHYFRQPAIASQLARARQCIEVPTFDEAEVQQRVLAAHASHRFDAVLCLLDIRLIEAARLASQLQLPFLNPTSAMLLRDKFKVRQRLTELGIETTPFALATSNAELKQAVDQLGLPVLVKPSDGYGSQNIVALVHPEDLDPFLSPLEDMLPSRADYGLGVKANDRLIVERLLYGKVIGCDTFTVNGQHQLLGVNEKRFFEPPSFAIKGGCFTPKREEHRLIEEHVFAILDAVGFDWGATHMELMLTADGPRLIEINPRLVGAKIPRLINCALGRSIHADLIALHLGQLSLPLSLPQDTYAATRWIVAEAPGVLKAVQLPNSNHEHVRCVEVLKQPGSAIKPPFENADRIGYVMTCAKTKQEAEESANIFVAHSTVLTA